MWKCPQCGRVNPGEAGVCSSCGSGAAAPAAASLTGELLRLLSEGNKLEAVKLYKDRTGATLLMAKNAVEALERGEPLPGASGATTQDAGDLQFSNELRSLLQQGNKIQAVKLYKDRTGASVMDAKRAVEALAGGPAGRAAGSAVAQEILPLLRMGELGEAIRLYQRRTGATRREAKRAVLELARQHNAYDGGSALLRVGLLLLVLIGVALLIFGGISLLGE